MSVSEDEPQETIVLVRVFFFFFFFGHYLEEGERRGQKSPKLLQRPMKSAPA